MNRAKYRSCLQLRLEGLVALCKENWLRWKQSLVLHKCNRTEICRKLLMQFWVETQQPAPWGECGETGVCLSHSWDYPSEREMVLSCLALQTLWYISPVYCTPCTLPSRSSHILLVVWKDPANRQGMAEGKTTNELGFTAKRGSSPSSISVLYLFYTCSSMFWGFFLLNVSSFPAAAAL